MKLLLFADNPEPNYFYFAQLQKKSFKINKLNRYQLEECLAAHRGNRFTWCSNILVPDDWQLSNDDYQKLEALRQRQILPDQFMIVWLDNVTGYGVYARKWIAQQSIIFYAGEVIPPTNQILAYGAGFRGTAATNAQYMGNHASLLQDLYPAHIALADFPINVARNNFTIKRLSLTCGDLAYLEAITDIAPGIQCGLEYGSSYWKGAHMRYQCVQQFFSETGEIITGLHEDFLRLQMLTEIQLKSLINPCEENLSKEQIWYQYIPADIDFIERAKTFASRARDIAKNEGCYKL